MYTCVLGKKEEENNTRKQWWWRSAELSVYHSRHSKSSCLISRCHSTVHCAAGCVCQCVERKLQYMVKRKWWRQGTEQMKIPAKKKKREGALAEREAMWVRGDVWRMMTWASLLGLLLPLWIHVCETDTLQPVSDSFPQKRVESPFTSARPGFFCVTNAVYVLCCLVCVSRSLCLLQSGA